MHKVNWLWQMDRLRFSISYLRWPIQEVMTFGFYQPVFKKVILAGLNSLWQKGCQISVKNWIFDDPFYKKGLVLIIWVLRMIKPSGSVIFWWNETVEVIEAIEAVDATEVIEAAEVLSPGKSLGCGTSSTPIYDAAWECMNHSIKIIKMQNFVVVVPHTVLC